MNLSRRSILVGTAASAATALATRAGAQSFPFKPNQRYPDPAIEILDPSFTKYRIYSSTLEQVGTGMRWAEGPAYFPDDGGYVLCLAAEPPPGEPDPPGAEPAAASACASAFTRYPLGLELSLEASPHKGPSRAGKRPHVSWVVLNLPNFRIGWAASMSRAAWRDPPEPLDVLVLPRAGGNSAGSQPSGASGSAVEAKATGPSASTRYFSGTTSASSRRGLGQGRKAVPSPSSCPQRWRRRGRDCRRGRRSEHAEALDHVGRWGVRRPVAHWDDRVHRLTQAPGQGRTAPGARNRRPTAAGDRRRPARPRGQPPAATRSRPRRPRSPGH